MCGDKQLIPESIRQSGIMLATFRTRAAASGASYVQQFQNTSITERKGKKGTLIHGDKHNTKVTNPTTASFKHVLSRKKSKTSVLNRN